MATLLEYKFDGGGSAFLVGKVMFIRIFYAVSGLSLLFFAAFFLQCCRLAPRKAKAVVRKLHTLDAYNAAEATRLFAQCEKEMAEFMARHGRSTALVFLLAANGLPLFLSNMPTAYPESIIAQANRRVLLGRNRNASVNGSGAAQLLCKKN